MEQIAELSKQEGLDALATALGPYANELTENVVHATCLAFPDAQNAAWSVKRTESGALFFTPNMERRIKALSLPGFPNAVIHATADIVAMMTNLIAFGTYTDRLATEGNTEAAAAAGVAHSELLAFMTDPSRYQADMPNHVKDDLEALLRSFSSPEARGIGLTQ